MNQSMMQAQSTNIRILPHNVEAEQSLLGAILFSNECFEQISEFLLPKHFATPVHENIYDAICKLISQGFIADPITLKAYFEKREELKDIGGGNYLIQLVNSVISIASAVDYARLICDLYIRRQLILIGEDLSHNALSFSVDVKITDQIEEAEAKLYAISMFNQRGGFVSFSEAISSTMESIENAYKSDSSITGITTGFIDLDKWLGGLNKSDVIILAGRPSMGKTALATNIAFNAALALMKKTDGGGKVAFFSLEMSKEQLVTRILSQESQIPSEKIRRGEIREEDYARLITNGQLMMELPLFIDDTPALTVSSIRIRARKLQRQYGLDLIVIDYLQLLQGAADRKNENRVQEISEITRSLKSLAKELDIPVLALSQLSRAVESRDDKRPQLSDLRESGSIEQDADVVCFIFREEYYEARREPASGTEEHVKWLDRMTKTHNLAELILAKQRHGPIGTIRLFFDGRFTKFDNLSDSKKTAHD
ncbi:MAG: replicative DNA helicase [Holosporaceae bacterium]|jgi:replicative DNA helicase|nr:replicative DNA helicase [Holosporaceae bacterium]